ncbi:hypothetical protein [Phenylobacterium aquaticum]|uniref:hypothetical protein n=1 Tax=Phenylobacterium aquaticum TaxID=1763816 RepID=UPI0026F287A3|nr:hypothetical protein [Phenylobacterium aquaticum]
MSVLADIENEAGLARVTCGWRLPHLSLDFVRPYWRDAHSPAIARRDGIYEYRHYPLDPIRGDLFTPVAGIDFAGRPGEQLQWLSDVRYADEAGMNAFGADPDPTVRAQILADIEMIVDKSTTYKVIGANARTLVDTTGDAPPLGPARTPIFQVFFRQRGDEAAFRESVSALAELWAATEGVLRVRRSLFETPDMEAERAAGYPVKTHPLEMQYQAWIDLVVADEPVARRLIPPAIAPRLAQDVSAIHAYPAPAAYTFNYRGKPTLAGLRGYAACEAIRNMGAEHQKDPGLLEWMYGPVAQGGTAA